MDMEISVTVDCGETAAVRVDKTIDLSATPKDKGYALTLIDDEVGTMIVKMGPRQFGRLLQVMEQMVEFSP